MAQAHGYDVIVLDVMLPGLDGFDDLPPAPRQRRQGPVPMLTARTPSRTASRASTRAPTTTS